MRIFISILAWILASIPVGSEYMNQTTTETRELDQVEFEIVLSNGDVYGVPRNPAFWNLRGGKPLANVSETPTDDRRKLGRVIGGVEAVRGEVPYQAGLMLTHLGLYCGGSIYNKDVIITAAHCFFEKGKLLANTEFAVAVGKTELGLSEEFEIVRAVKEVILHPGFVPKREGFNDIAIARLKRPLCFNPHVQPIRIAPKDFMPNGEMAISGWGYTEIRRPGDPHHRYGRTTQLRTGKVRMVPPDKCAQHYEEMGIPGSIVTHESIICAGVEDGSSDTCQGDSGGPLVCGDQNGNQVLCGVVSSGVGCGQPNSPALYMKVSYFHDWILANAGLPDEPCI